MINGKLETQSKDESNTFVVLFISRKEDNNDIPGFRERKEYFITKENKFSPKLHSMFNTFVEQGICGEISCMHYSLNPRNDQEIYNNLLHFLIDNPEFDLSCIQSKLAEIATISKDVKNKKCLFDFNSRYYDRVLEFCTDIEKIDETLVMEIYKTPNGYVIEVDRSFDIGELKKKWGGNFTIKNDDLICIEWKKKESEV